MVFGAMLACVGSATAGGRAHVVIIMNHHATLRLTGSIRISRLCLSARAKKIACSPECQGTQGMPRVGSCAAEHADWSLLVPRRCKKVFLAHPWVALANPSGMLPTTWRRDPFTSCAEPVWGMLNFMRYMSGTLFALALSAE